MKGGRNDIHIAQFWADVSGFHVRKCMRDYYYGFQSKEQRGFRVNFPLFHPPSDSPSLGIHAGAYSTSVAAPGGRCPQSQ